MKNALHFKRLSSDDPCLQITWNGKPLDAVAGETVAACLLANSVLAFQGEDLSDPPRGPFCMMGACYTCRVLVNGVEQQACMVEVKQDMHVSCVDPEKEILHAGS